MGWNMGRLQRSFSTNLDRMKTNKRILEHTLKNRNDAKIISTDDLSKEMIPQPAEEKATISVVNKSTLEVAEDLITSYNEVAVLLHTDLYHIFDENDQFKQMGELCRNTTLYPSLCSSTIRNKFYNYNKSKKKSISDRLFYIPEVLIYCREWGGFQRFLSSDLWGMINVIGAAVPYISSKTVSDEEIKVVLRKEIDAIFATAVLNHNEAIVLGAWGCGEDGLDAQIVSQVFYEAIEEKWKWYFKQIVFAILDLEEEGSVVGQNNYVSFWETFFIHEAVNEETSEEARKEGESVDLE